MKLKSCLLFSLFCFAIFLHAQKGEIIAHIDGNPIYKSEVVRAYEKNSSNIVQEVPVDSFIQSYVNIKLNVAEALSQKLDTTFNYRRQYMTYKIQLANTFFEDTTTSRYDADLKEAYNRILTDVELNQFFIPFYDYALLPSDTARYYKKALEAREYLLKEGFPKVKDADIKENASVKDPATTSGYLGWIIPFLLPKQIEDEAYQLSVSEISLPIRTDKGYHIIQVINKRKAIGTSEIDQIAFYFPNVPATAAEIDSVKRVAEKTYQEMINGRGFDPFCKAYGKAYGSEGCHLGPINLRSQMPKTFIDAALNLQHPGDISKPVMTEYGFHILRLEGRAPIPAFEFSKEVLLPDVKRRMEPTYSEKEIQEKIKTFGIKINQEAYNMLMQTANTYMPDSASYIEHVTDKNKTIIELPNKNIPVKDFLSYIEKQAVASNPNTTEMLPYYIVDLSETQLSTDRLNKLFQKFLNKEIRAYEFETLEERVPNFKIIMDDFSDGLLYFDIMDKNVWQKAEENKEGINNFFNENKSKYKWSEPKFRGIIVTCSDEVTLTKARALAKQAQRGEDIAALLTNSLNSEKENIKIQNGLWAKGDNAYTDRDGFGIAGSANEKTTGDYAFAIGTLTEQPESAKEVGAKIQSDYQNQLEKEWIQKLQSKHTIDLDKKKIKSLIKELR